MKKLPILVVAIVLAIGSFAYARHHYVSKNSVTLTNPFKASEHTTVTSPLADDKLFGDWVKDEWIFAIAVPVALIAGGAVLAFKK